MKLLSALLNENKKCTKCEELKPLSEFHKSKYKRDGLVAHCKTCVKEKHAVYYINNKEKLKIQHEKYYEENKNHLLELGRERYQENREKIIEQTKIWHQKHPEKAKAAVVKWRTNNREKQCQATKNWKKRNPDKVRELKRGQYQRYKQDISFVLAGRVSNALRYSLKNNKTKVKANRKWEELIDFTIDQLKAHLEKLFTPEMNWDNYGTYWHIDHKTPIAVFNFERPEDIDFKICWSLKNLQPLEAHENMSKNDKIDKPFQPSLAIAV
ncbi:MAG: hypothetical protein ABFD63_01190 [Smithella sp.]